jgi:hypothetical protein
MFLIPIEIKMNLKNRLSPLETSFGEIFLEGPPMMLQATNSYAPPLILFHRPFPALLQGLKYRHYFRHKIGCELIFSSLTKPVKVN